MCWGLQPTLFFVVSEASVLIAIYVRNERNDRFNCLLHTPLLLQETIQLLLWAQLAREADASADKCSSLNEWLSMLEAGIVCFVPGWLAVYASRTQPPGPRGCVLKRQLEAWAILCGGYTAIVIVCIMVAQRFGLCPRCTVAGPWGHQLWPFLSLRPWVLVIMHYVNYIHLCLPGVALVGRHTMAPLFILCTFWLPVALQVAIGNEWGSFWCFTASLACFLYPFEPMLLRLQERQALLKPGGVARTSRASRVGDSEATWILDRLRKGLSGCEACGSSRLLQWLADVLDLLSATVNDDATAFAYLHPFMGSSGTTSATPAETVGQQQDIDIAVTCDIVGQPLEDCVDDSAALVTRAS